MNFYNLFDANFTYTLNEYGIVTASHRFLPQEVTWVLQRKKFPHGPTVFTDRYISRNNIDFIRSVDSPFKVAWLVEPKSIHPWPYEEIKYMINEFDLVLSHHEEIISLGDNVRWIPGCGTWIDPQEWSLYPKTKKVCIIASSKNTTEGHKLRHSIVNKFGNSIDVYGKGYRPFPEKLDVLKNYMFSIEVENCSKENYFTEKLHDCLAVGTIPIYYGPKKGLGDFYDINGILPFSGIEDLGLILESLDSKLYLSKARSVSHNLESAKKFAIVDDYVCKVVETFRGEKNA